eukprot:6997177-Pyramimonas_sp.AAC.1
MPLSTRPHGTRGALSTKPKPRPLSTRPHGSTRPFSTRPQGSGGAQGATRPQGSGTPPHTTTML